MEKIECIVKSQELIGVGMKENFGRHGNEKTRTQRTSNPEFLSTLHSAVECCGWDVDMVESMEFCNWCYNCKFAETHQDQYFWLDDMSFEMEDEE
jgi:hypothetical protein